MESGGNRQGPLRGRGASWNPPNRFESIEVELDPEAFDEDAPPPRTQYLRDASRTIIARNDSPDVGFDRSVNPYRGCSHGCLYCLEPDAPVLHADMVWRPLGEIASGDEIYAFDELPGEAHSRRSRRAVVEDVWWSRKPTWRIITRNTEILATSEHRWLLARPGRWRRTEQLKPGRALRYLPVFGEEPLDEDFQLGYVCGMSLGDGTFRYEPGWRSRSSGFPAAYWRVALVDEAPLQRLVTYLRTFAIDTVIRPFSTATKSRKALNKVETRSIPKLAILRQLLRSERSTRAYRRGFLSGFFDAEGSSGESLRISQVDLGVLERVRQYAASLGFRFVLEPRPGRASTLRLVGRLVDRIRFFGLCRPAIARKHAYLFGRELYVDDDEIVAVEPGPVTDVVDIQTSTQTFYAAGLATHNCFARPTHEYLGFSAGLDFETKILVKERAPELLREELASPRWKPQVVALSGVTDAYQPVERKLGLTRRCLEVLAEFRNPVLVVTKNCLVTRDADLLGDLARDAAAAVFVSMTTLRQELTRVLEPRTSAPARRLEAIAALARAGVPVGVLVAPVIPALNDHEILPIVRAAADAGARFAGHVPLRLPWAVKELFERWLEEHFPDRKDKVLNRIRSLRGGKLNDPGFRTRMQGEGAYAAEIHDLFALAVRRAGLDGRPKLSAAAFRRPGQLPLFR